jgi:mRNA-degrading endonuclease RelE of RelBE toxin-antitoxin system
MWSIQVSREAVKHLKRLPKNVQEIALLALEALKNEGPVPKHWDFKDGPS